MIIMRAFSFITANDLKWLFAVFSLFSEISEKVHCAIHSPQIRFSDKKMLFVGVCATPKPQTANSLEFA